MSALLKPDPSRGPGFGIMEVPGVAPSVAPTFALYRASDGQCLSPNGWQNTEFFLQPDAWDADSGLLRLAVGPAVVDCMDTLDTYRLLIRADSTTAQTLLVQDILYSPSYGGGGIVTEPPQIPAAAQTTIPEPPAPEDPAPEPVSPTPDPVPEPVPVPEDNAEPLRMAEPEPQPQRSKLPLLLALAVLLLAAGGGIWWYLHRAATPEAPTAQTAPAKDAAQTPTPAPATDASAVPSADAPAAPVAAAPQPPMDIARQHLRGNADAQKSVDLARGMTDADAADAAFLLVEDAAQKGQAEAMLRLGAFYDPASTAPRGSIAPDAEQAYTWYAKALTAGRQEAQSALHTLRAWVDAAAAKGDSAAADLQRRWKTTTP